MAAATFLAASCCETSRRSRTAVMSSGAHEMQRTLQRLSESVESQAQRIADLERVTPKEFELVHYNLLADHASSNLNPWFLYGANVTAEERTELTRRFYEGSARGYKDAPNKGWPAWAIDVLSPERRALLEEYNRNYFAWDRRCERLWEAVRSVRVGARCRSPDLLTLAECDHYDDFWEQRLRESGYDSVWRRRPRAGCTDGSAIAWRASTFSLIAQSGFDFGSSLASDPKKMDRTCLFTLLRWRRDPSSRLLVATTHLARDPESVKQRYARAFQCTPRHLPTSVPRSCLQGHPPAVAHECLLPHSHPTPTRWRHLSRTSGLCWRARCGERACGTYGRPECQGLR